MGRTVSELMSGNISNAITNIKTWGGVIVNVKEYGVKGDGVSDDTAALQDVITRFSDIFMPIGTYRVTSPIVIGKGKRIVGATGSLLGPSTVIRASVADFGEGAAIFVLNDDDDTNVQDILIESIYIRGDNETIQPGDLSTGTDTGLVGIDTAHVKDHIVIRDCSFRGLKRAIGQRQMVDYSAQVHVDSCRIVSCYRAFEGRFTTHLYVSDCDVRECCDWAIVNNLSVINTTFNNSSFATNNTGLNISNKGLIQACWFEGGNHQVRMSADGANIVCVNNQFGAAFSDSGATRYHVFLRPGKMTLIGNKMSNLTRMFDFTEGGQDYSTYTIRMIDNDVPTFYWKFGSYDPDAMGFNYFGDADFDTKTKRRTIDLGDLNTGGTSSKTVVIGRLDGNYKYKVEVYGIANNGNSPRIAYEDVHLVNQANDNRYTINRLNDLNLMAVSYSDDTAANTFSMTVTCSSATSCRNVLLIITAYESPIIGTVS